MDLGHRIENICLGSARKGLLLRFLQTSGTYPSSLDLAPATLKGSSSNGQAVPLRSYIQRSLPIYHNMPLNTTTIGSEELSNYPFSNTSNWYISYLRATYGAGQIVAVHAQTPDARRFERSTSTHPNARSNPGVSIQGPSLLQPSARSLARPRVYQEPRVDGGASINATSSFTSLKEPPDFSPLRRSVEVINMSNPAIWLLQTACKKQS